MASHSPLQEVKATTGTEARSLLREEVSNHLTEKPARQDATDPKQKAVTDYKEQVDRHPLPHCTG
jgi:hypothetical protein